MLIQNNGVDSLLYAYSDFQGSLIALTDVSGKVVEKYAYDPWGARRNPTDWTQKDLRTKWITNRGYTRHEHLDAFGIINMNGRVYDPLTAMFMSPDPYVQAPGNWLNYNRYGYCMGNPFRYTDPSGYNWWSDFTHWVGNSWKPILAVAAATVFCITTGGFGAALIGAGAFGVGNLAVQAINGNIHNFGDALGAFGQGAVAGYCLGAGIGAGLQVPILSTIIKGAAYLDAGATALSAVKGLGQGVFTGDWSGLSNAGKIFLGNFALNDKLSGLGGAWEGISRFSWEGIQQTLGYSFNQVYNSVSNNTSVHFFDGATLVNSDVEGGGNWGLTMGNFIMGQNLRASISNPTFMHEYGHTIQSGNWGLLYPFAVAIPSGWNYLFGNGSRIVEYYNGFPIQDHQLRWYEEQASGYAADYFKKYYGIDWSEGANPTPGF